VATLAAGGGGIYDGDAYETGLLLDLDRIRPAPDPHHARARARDQREHGARAPPAASPTRAPRRPMGARAKSSCEGDRE